MTFTPRSNFTRQEIAAACRRYGPEIGPLPPGVDGTRLLWALCGVESSFGADCQPRHEPSYDVGGKYAHTAPMPILLHNYGAAGACSYGPLQLMLINAPTTYGPTSFDSIDLAFQASTRFLNGRLRAFEAQIRTLDAIGSTWNAGHPSPDPSYNAKLRACYATEIP